MTIRNSSLFEALTEIHHRPEPFSIYTAQALWDDDFVSQNMLNFHLDEDAEPASRPHAFIQRSADWIAGEFSLAEGRRVADFGCGPGLYATRFAAAGASVTGIDFSRRSIDYARQEARKQEQAIDFVLADYLEYQASGSFDLITLLYCDLCALSGNQRRQLLCSFRDMLAKGGSVLLDVFSLQAFAGRTEASSHGFRMMDGFWAPGDYWGFNRTFKYNREKVVLDKYTIIEAHQSRQVFNWLQFFSFNSLVEEFKECGLQIVKRYADLAGSPFAEGDVFAVVARKIE